MYLMQVQTNFSSGVVTYESSPFEKSKSHFADALCFKEHVASSSQGFRRT